MDYILHCKVFAGRGTTMPTTVAFVTLYTSMYGKPATIGTTKRSKLEPYERTVDQGPGHLDPSLNVDEHTVRKIGCFSRHFMERNTHLCKGIYVFIYFD